MVAVVCAGGAAIPRFVAWLRGVNVGGRNRLAMSELRALVASLGYEEVTTLIQSGNVIFSGEEAPPERLSAAIDARFGLAVTVVVRTAEELARVVGANPFPEADEASLHVAFMAARPAPAAIAALDPGRHLPERFVVAGEDLYLHLPSGMAATKLPAYLGRGLGVAMTLRNWTTTRRLLELAAG